MPCDNHLLGRDDRCVVIATAIFVDRLSCRQKVRRSSVAAAFCRPTVHQQYERCAMQSHVVALDFSLLFKYIFGTRRDRLCFLSQRRPSVFLRPWPRPQVLHVSEKDASVKCLDAVPGKVHLPCWRFIVVRNGPGVVFWQLNLPFCVCGVVTKFLHCVYLTIRGKLFFLS